MNMKLAAVLAIFPIVFLMQWEIKHNVTLFEYLLNLDWESFLSSTFVQFFSALGVHNYIRFWRFRVLAIRKAKADLEENIDWDVLWETSKFMETHNEVCEKLENIYNTFVSDGEYVKNSSKAKTHFLEKVLQPIVGSKNYANNIHFCKLVWMENKYPYEYH